MGQYHRNIQYAFNTAGLPLSFKTRDYEGNLAEACSFSYNDLNQLVSERQVANLKEDPKFRPRRVNRKEYEYKDGLRVAKYSYKDEMALSEERYKYTGNNLLKEVQEKGIDNTWETILKHTYDSNGLLIRSINRGRETTYSYDHNSRIIREDTFYNQKLPHTKTNKWEEDNLVEVIYQDGDGNLTNHIEMEYDNTGRRIKEAQKQYPPHLVKDRIPPTPVTKETRKMLYQNNKNLLRLYKDGELQWEIATFLSTDGLIDKKVIAIGNQEPYTEYYGYTFH